MLLYKLFQAQNTFIPPSLSSSMSAPPVNTKSGRQFLDLCGTRLHMTLCDTYYQKHLFMSIYLLVTKGRHNFAADVITINFTSRQSQSARAASQAKPSKASEASLTDKSNYRYGCVRPTRYKSLGFRSVLGCIQYQHNLAICSIQHIGACSERCRMYRKVTCL